MNHAFKNEFLHFDDGNDDVFICPQETKSLTGLWLLVLWSAGLGLASYVAMTTPGFCA